MRRLLALVALLAFVAVPLNAFGVPMSMSRSVSFVDANNGFMAGSRTDGFGFISRTTNGGATWQSFTVAGPRVNVHALSGGTGFGVSPWVGLPYRTINSGLTWPAVPGQFATTTCQPWDVRQLTSTSAVVVGSMDHPVHGTLSAIWRTADSGNTWSLVDSGPIYPYDPIAEEYPQTIAGHFAVDADPTGQIVYAVGREKTLVASGEDSYYETYKQAVIRRSTNGGLSWTERLVDNVTMPDPGLEDVASVDTNAAYAVGGRRVFRTTDAGVTWSVIPSGAYNYLRLSAGPVEIEAIDATSANHVLVAGALDSPTNPRGTIARTVDGGVTWESYIDEAKLTFRDVTVISATRAIAVGDDNLVVALDLSPDGKMTLVKRAFATNGTFSVDAAVPTVTMTPVYSSGLTKVTIEAVDDVQVQEISYRLNGATTWVTVPGNTATIDLTGVGQNTVEYKAKDTSGKTSAVASATLYVKLGTSLSLSAPSTSSYGSAKVTGILKDVNGKALAGKRVVVQYWGSGAWRSLGTATTYSNGSYSYTVKPTVNTAYRAVFSSDTTHIGTVSSTRAIKPKVYLTTPVASTTMTYGRTYSAYGYIKPRHTSGTYPVKLYAYRYESGRWVLRKTYSAKASNYYSYSKYSASVKPPGRGKWRIRAYHASDSLNAATYSSYRYITVK